MKDSEIGLLLEGSYPYVSGGVGMWVHQLIENLPEFRFDLIVLVAKKDDKLTWKYPRLENIQRIYQIPLQEGFQLPTFLPSSISIKPQFDDLIKNKITPESFLKFAQSVQNAPNPRTLKQQFLYSQEILETIEGLYNELGFQGQSFLEFFWMMRTLFLGYLNVLLSRVPKCGLYHTVSTGYAGLLGSIIKRRYASSPLVLTEHGIYTRERKMEIALREWPDANPDDPDPLHATGRYREIWSKSFSFMSEMCYKSCDSIISLSESNNYVQFLEGADPSKIQTIRNGIELHKFSFRHRKKPSEKPRIGFLGRIVRIKDVKTLLRSAAVVVKKIPGCHFDFGGGTEEDPEYFEECEELNYFLGLRPSVTFWGKVNPKSFLEKIDLMVLTSLSEGQPLVMLEAMARGIPIVCTNVGGCKEIIQGHRDDPLGVCGIVTRQVNPQETADAIVKLLGSPAFYSSCSLTGRKRVERYYNQDAVITNYRDLYREFLKRGMEPSQNSPQERKSA
ncbi:GT4 family glycosyltransferase PelF [bacterium]|jgi:polysaccharide biosynthesis protein PelF|nr:GT4 family glycosyltransferase PelF [bacterium]